ncbi:MAG: SGNH/GDSL hydrolase family protein [Edaphobacter sp.]|uniref:SGNH/GDSL hydrolase family protein n=1 Tax=Edaphobacter sp. TaxID=1934404 RepID=UPI0023871ED2|nr:SGNH/GDSL hydrolase family protein [Edaphobacter sp.]MDE1176030.1 SGNH/GDSL hydrolase family protein [Edaphobacter sp.]
MGFVAPLCGVAQNLPKLFLVGDSISIYYTPFLQSDVANIYSFSRKTSPKPESIAQQLSDPEVQGGNSRMVLEYLQKRYEQEDFRPDVVLINCGLHDIKRIPQTNAIAIDPSEYRSNLEKMIALVRKHHGKIVWINSTPVDDARHNSLSKEFYRYDRDVIQYNEIARQIFSSAGAPVIDLYTFTKQLGAGHYIDHIHWDEGTRSQQAAFIAGFLSASRSSHVLP